jgi:hypothetical protein
MRYSTMVSHKRMIAPMSLLLQIMCLEGTENESRVEEESKMELLKSDVSGSSLASASAVKGEESRQLVHGRPVGLTITVEKIDRVLADVQAQIATLELERTNLGLVRAELARMEVKWRSA